MVPARVARAMSAAPQLNKRSDNPGPSCMQRPVSVQAKRRIAHRSRAITRSRQFSDRRRSTRGHCSSANLKSTRINCPSARCAGKIDETTKFDPTDFRNSVPRFSPEARKANGTVTFLRGRIEAGTRELADGGLKVESGKADSFAPEVKVLEGLGRHLEPASTTS